MEQITQEFKNFLLTCKPTFLDNNERYQLGNMREKCAYYYGPYIQFFYQNQFYVTRVTEFSKQMLKDAGYTLHNTSELSKPVPIYNYSVAGEDTNVIDEIIRECMMATARHDYTSKFTVNKFGGDIDFDATRRRIASDPQVREFICKKLLESDELRYIYALNGDKIYRPEFNSFLSQIVTLDTETFKHYLAANSAYLYFTPEQREKSAYLEFFEKNVVPTMDAILESYADTNKPTR